MATGLPPPDIFRGNTEAEFLAFKTRLDRFFATSKIVEDQAKIDYLMYLLDPKYEQILQSFRLTEEEAESYGAVCDRFVAYFRPRQHVVYSRSLFNDRRQTRDEPVEEFITDVHRMIKHCAYPAEMEDLLLRDRIAVGIANKSLRDKLVFDETLTLQTCLATIRSWSLQEAHASELHSRMAEVKEPQPAANAVKGRNRANARKWAKVKEQTESDSQQKNCGRCGCALDGSRHRCPAKRATCKKCGKRGHYGAMCRSKRIHAINEDSDDPCFLGQVSVIKSVKETDFMIKLKVDNKVLTFDLDTGADVTVVGHTCIGSRPLQKPDLALDGVGGNRLNVLGYYFATIRAPNGSTCREKIYVVENQPKALLGKPAIAALKLIQKCYKTSPKPEVTVFEDFPELFKGLGTMNNCEYRIELRPNSVPFAINAPRRIAQPLLKPVAAELEKMERQGVIRKLSDNEVTEYVAPLVVAPKPNGKLRICVDLSKLNDNVVRHRHVLPSVDESLAKLGHGRVFSKIDAYSGFWQVPLANESQLLTTFLTPFGRYCYRKLPFGITSGPEFFQSQIDRILRNTPHCANLIDDFAVASATAEEHKTHLYAVLSKLQKAGITLNREKCAFFVDEIEFVGHRINGSGICADERKMAAIKELPTPTCVTDLRSFMGMCQQLSRFSPRLSQLAEPLRDLLSTKNDFVWDRRHDDAFQAIKHEICSSRVLRPYVPHVNTRVMTDSSRSGFGAVLMQQDTADGMYKPVCFASKSLSSAEKNYSIIELEAASIVWACQKFEKYLLGMKFEVMTDHKPLISLLGEKSMDRLPPRIVRFRLALMRYHFTVTHIPGKENQMADCLSRASIHDDHPSTIEKEAEAFISGIMGNMPATDRRLAQIKEMQMEDEVCQKLMEYANTGWPDTQSVPSILKPYSTFKDEFSICDGMLMKGDRIVIPSSMRLDMLEHLHSGHLGIEKIRKRMIDTVWWPNASKQVEDMVRTCRVCCNNQREQAEPLLPTPLPARPWQRCAADICELQGRRYMVVYDYYSRWIDFMMLTTMTGVALVRSLQLMCARYGVMETLVCDNQFDCGAVNAFARDYGITVVTSSPRMPSANGAAERAVQTFKNLMKKNSDPYLALLSYRTTPLADGYSPAEKLFGRKLRTNVPQAPAKLLPSYSDVVRLGIQAKDQQQKERQKFYHDRYHGATQRPPLQPGSLVQIRDRNEQATVVGPADNAPRSYIVQTDQATYRRNRRHLDETPRQRPTRARRQPERYGDFVTWDKLRQTKN